MPLVLSLFPGVGILDRAFEEEGFTVVRGPDVLWGGDVRTFHPPPGVFNGVIGGPPCQAFSSLANLVRAKGHEPRFGNLTPEFERCVSEAAPDWFLMENVRAAPLPEVDGYSVADFLLCNSWLDAGDGMGEEQERKRRFSFGVRGESAPDLRRWIKPAALLLPAPSSAVRAGSSIQPTTDFLRNRQAAVLADSRETPVKLGGSGRVKRNRQSAVASEETPSQRVRQRAVDAGHTGPSGRPKDAKGGRGSTRRSLAEMNRLQGLPEDFLADAPFTVTGKRKAIANGVPIPMGRAVAGAIKHAVELLASDAASE